MPACARSGVASLRAGYFMIAFLITILGDMRDDYDIDNLSVLPNLYTTTYGNPETTHSDVSARCPV